MADKTPVKATDWIAQGETFETSSGHRIWFTHKGTGPTIVLLHGFPTWSYDYADLAADLAVDHDVIVLDFLGYGASAKPRHYEFSVAEAADTVEAMLVHLNRNSARLVLHDFGGIVGQELLYRQLNSKPSFEVECVYLLNCGVIYHMYRPTVIQRLLANSLTGPVVARLANRRTVRRSLDAVRGEAKLTDAEFAELWAGISLDGGHKLGDRLIRYNAERAINHERWLTSLQMFDKPLHLIWGMADPVSGAHVLAAARAALPNAAVTALDGVGHFPQSEAPRAVADAIRSIRGR